MIITLLISGSWWGYSTFRNFNGLAISSSSYFLAGKYLRIFLDNSVKHISFSESCNLSGFDRNFLASFLKVEKIPSFAYVFYLWKRLYSKLAYWAISLRVLSSISGMLRAINVGSSYENIAYRGPPIPSRSIVSSTLLPFIKLISNN